MAVTSLVKFLLVDEVSLSAFRAGDHCDIDELKRRLFVKAREENRHLPDHFYRLEFDRSLSGIDSLADLLTKGLGDLATECLSIENNRIVVKTERQNDWQELITYIPPLILQASLLWKYQPIPIDFGDFVPYFDQFILPNTRYTALPQPKIPVIDEILAKHKGLHDLHMHLNGATETDVVWQDYLFNPYDFQEALGKGFENERVKEQLLQESPFLAPVTFVEMLVAARKMRRYLYDFLFSKNFNAYSTEEKILFKQFLDASNRDNSSYQHEFSDLISKDDQYPFTLSSECLMYVLVITKLREKTPEIIARTFHFYLLILGLANRLLVQQVHQKGFEQFHKHHLSRMRNFSEKDYKRRFLQINGNDQKNIQFLEGRLNQPPKSAKKLYSLVGNISSAWENTSAPKVDPETQKEVPKEKGNLKLIIHYIKKPDLHRDAYIRHKELRIDIRDQARILNGLLMTSSPLKGLIVGIDAASSEFDAPPEVFAPVYRYLRRQGMQHFTYHAGEDFFHVLSGLQAIYEAIVFCDLRRGDRIGHATAAGISVEQWQQVVGRKILMRKGEYLDSLVFAYHLTNLFPAMDIPAVQVVKLSNEIEKLCQSIYGKSYPPPLLVKAWQMRQVSPLESIPENGSRIHSLKASDPDEWSFIADAGLFETLNPVSDDPAWAIYREYHDKYNQLAYDAIEPIDSLGIFSIKDLNQLQRHLLQFMNDRGIVIETLPTSNIRIGLHRNFSTYHLLDWIKWSQSEFSVPPIVVGSDDPGIFATNIYNEYANIYCSLSNLGNSSVEGIENIIKKLDSDSKQYRFEYL